MPDPSFNPVFTDAGRAAVAAADGAGMKATIAEIALGAGVWASRNPDSTATAEALGATALQNEVVRVPLQSGASLSPNQIAMSAQVPAGTPTFWVTEIGIILDDGTLLAVAARDSAEGFGWRGELVPWVFRFVLSWSDLPANSITVVFDGDAGQAANFLAQQQLTAQLKKAVEDAGLTWDASDAAVVSQAWNLLSGSNVSAILTPSITSPADGATSVGETPAIAGSTYYSLYGVALADCEVQLATDAAFTAGLLNFNAGSAVTSVTVPAANLTTDTTYFVRLRYTDVEANNSDWSETISFSTGSTFIATAQPTNTTPPDAAPDVVLVPTLTASAFAVSGGGSDTHQSSQWLIEKDLGGGSWQTTWDSGEVAGATSITVTGVILENETDYRWSVRYRGATLGWSDWSVPTTFTTHQPSGSFTSVTPGSNTFTVPAGVQSIRVTLIGPGGSGGGYGGLGGGGGGGGGARKTYTVVPFQQFSYTLGTPGPGSVAGDSGVNGTTSTFHTDLSATGGAGGLSSSSGGVGGQGIGGDVNGTGGAGGAGGGTEDVNVRPGYAASLIGGGGGASGESHGATAIGGVGADAGGPGQNNGAGRPAAAADGGGGGAGAGVINGISGAGGNPKLLIEWGPGI